MTTQELAAAVIALCIIGIIYFGGARILDEQRRANLPAWHWGDAQRRDDDDGEPDWFASDAACLVYLAFVLAMLYRLLK